MGKYVLTIPDSTSEITPLKAKCIAEKVTDLLSKSISIYCQNGRYNQELVRCSNIPDGQPYTLFNIYYINKLLGSIEVKDKKGLITVDIDLFGKWPVSAHIEEDLVDSLEAVLVRGSQN